MKNERGLSDANGQAPELMTQYKPPSEYTMSRANLWRTGNSTKKHAARICRYHVRFDNCRVFAA